MIVDFDNKVLFQKCSKITSAVNNITKLTNLVANDSITKLRTHLQPTNPQEVELTNPEVAISLKNEEKLTG